MKLNDLSEQEKAIILHRGTEHPFTGKYVDHTEDGVYRCRQCDAELYASETKFESHCGWPSFDDALDGAVKEHLDPDGRRTEIVCASCGGHLGHVFKGEGFTAQNVRHCVNSASLDFTGKTGSEGKWQTAVFASGCFWGTEYYMKRATGVKSTRVGYTGGTVEAPTYQQVCNENTGHAEAVEVTFDPAEISYEELARLFFETHDPTQVDRQGPDIGSQYRSELFYQNARQKEIAESLIRQLRMKGF